MTEVEEKNAKETDKVESALQRAIHISSNDCFSIALERNQHA